MSLFAGKDITCVRGDRTVFAKLDFALESGSALVLLGPNGSGKSSLLRLLTGLLKPVEGTITWEGAPVADDPEAHNARLHYVGHLDALKPALTVVESLRFWAGMAGGGKEDRAVEAALARFGLDHLSDIPCRLLSSGQRRRLTLARIIAAPAPLWLLDEPTVGLDTESLAAFEQALAQHLHDGGMAAIATHTAIALSPAQELQMAEFAVPWFAGLEEATAS